MRPEFNRLKAGLKTRFHYDAGEFYVRFLPT